jgi:2Fe-2S ferredoxin
LTRLIFETADGTRREVEANPDGSVMEAALAHGVQGIVAECNGSLACATCHVLVDGVIADALGPPVGAEDDMLDFVAVDRLPTSRLSCQVKVADCPEGAVIKLPYTQI